MLFPFSSAIRPGGRNTYFSPVHSKSSVTTTKPSRVLGLFRKSNRKVRDDSLIIIDARLSTGSVNEPTQNFLHQQKQHAWQFPFTDRKITRHNVEGPWQEEVIFNAQAYHMDPNMISRYGRDSRKMPLMGNKNDIPFSSNYVTSPSINAVPKMNAWDLDNKFSLLQSWDSVDSAVKAGIPNVVAFDKDNQGLMGTSRLKSNSSFGSSPWLVSLMPSVLNAVSEETEKNLPKDLEAVEVVDSQNKSSNSAKEALDYLTRILDPSRIGAAFASMVPTQGTETAARTASPNVLFVEPCGNAYDVNDLYATQSPMESINTKPTETALELLNEKKTEGGVDENADEERDLNEVSQEAKNENLWEEFRQVEETMGLVENERSSFTVLVGRGENTNADKSIVVSRKRERGTLSVSSDECSSVTFPENEKQNNKTLGASAANRNVMSPLGLTCVDNFALVCDNDDLYESYSESFAVPRKTKGRLFPVSKSQQSSKRSKRSLWRTGH